MAYTDPRDRKRPEAPSRDWDEDFDEDLYREPQEGQPPERQRETEPGRPGSPGEQPNRRREHSPNPTAR